MFFNPEVKQSFGNPRTQEFLSKVMDAINGKPVSTILTEHYPLGRWDFGNKVYLSTGMIKCTRNGNEKCTTWNS